ncbi:MAG: hypothetical protein U0R52_12260 [Solirubrobacterales bacterium]
MSTSRTRFLVWVAAGAMIVALLAPAFARAGSAGVQYKDALPTATGKKKNKGSGGSGGNGSGSQGSGNGSAVGGSGSGGSGSGGSGSASTGSGGTSAPAGGASGSGSASGSASSGAANASGGTAAAGSAASSGSQGSAEQVNLGQQAGYKSPSDSGGSSPLSAVLIAIAGLAVISAAVVVLRSRRDRHSGGALHDPYAG